MDYRFLQNIDCKSTDSFTLTLTAFIKTKETSYIDIFLSYNYYFLNHLHITNYANCEILYELLQNTFKM